MRRLITHERLAACAGEGHAELLQDLAQVTVGRTGRGVWIDTALPAYAAMARKYPRLLGGRPSASQRVPDGFAPENWHMDSTGAPGRCCE